MDIKFSSISRDTFSWPCSQDIEFEWLLCLCSAFQSKGQLLSNGEVTSFRAGKRHRVIAASNLRRLEGRDTPPHAKVPIKSPIHTLRDASRRRLAG
jgi:hypothetical protein